MSEGISGKLARFVTNVQFADMPKPVVQKAKEQILDELGVALGTSTLPWCKAVYDYVREVGAPGRVTVVNHGFQTNAEFAAMANATFAHGFEMDDYHPPAAGHPGCVAVPAALALAEEVGGSGQDFLVGTVVADEVIQRFALTAGTSFVHDRGIHASSAEGVFGGVAAASRLLGLSVDQATHAFGLAASHASGVMEFAAGGGEVKRYHAGLGASGGIRSALLARKGLTAPPLAIEGKRGVLQALAATYDVSKLTEGLGEGFMIGNIAFKTYAAPADLHPPIEGVMTLKRQFGLQAKDIADIEVGVHKLAIWHLGSVGPRPKDASAAQFSIHYGLALAMVKDSNSFATLLEQMNEGFSDPAILAIADKVHIVLDEETERLYPGVRQAKVTIRTTDGRTLTQLAVGCKGMPDKPMNKEELEAKFRGLAALVLPVEKVDGIIRAVWDLDHVSNITALTRLLVA